MTEGNLQQLTKNYTYDVAQVSPNIHKAILDNFYKHIPKPIVIDKHRGWTKNIATYQAISHEKAKVIATYRPIAENIASFIKLCNKDPNNAVDNDLRQVGKSITNENRARYIWEHWTLEIYQSLKYGLDNHRENIHIVHYNDLVSDPQQELNKIYDFLEIKRFDHQLTNIVNTCAEQKDEIWGFKGLHDVRPTIERQSLDPAEILPPEMLRMFKVYDDLLKL